MSSSISDAASASEASSSSSYETASASEARDSRSVSECSEYADPSEHSVSSEVPDHLSKHSHMTTKMPDIDTSDRNACLRAVDDLCSRMTEEMSGGPAVDDAMEDMFIVVMILLVVQSQMERNGKQAKRREAQKKERRLHVKAWHRIRQGRESLGNTSSRRSGAAPSQVQTVEMLSAYANGDGIDANEAKTEAAVERGGRQSEVDQKDRMRMKSKSQKQHSERLKHDISTHNVQRQDDSERVYRYRTSHRAPDSAPIRRIRLTIEAQSQQHEESSAPIKRKAQGPKLQNELGLSQQSAIEEEAVSTNGDDRLLQPHQSIIIRRHRKQDHVLGEDDDSAFEAIIKRTSKTSRNDGKSQKVVHASRTQISRRGGGEPKLRFFNAHPVLPPIRLRRTTTRTCELRIKYRVDDWVTQWVKNRMGSRRARFRARVPVGGWAKGRPLERRAMARPEGSRFDAIVKRATKRLRAYRKYGASEEVRRSLHQDDMSEGVRPSRTPKNSYRPFVVDAGWEDTGKGRQQPWISRRKRKQRVRRLKAKAELSDLVDDVVYAPSKEPVRKREVVSSAWWDEEPGL